MNINFDVGKKEKHNVEFFFDKFWGNIHFKVDGKIVQRHFIMFSLSTTKRYGLVVGETEKHKVEVEMKRPRFFAGFRGGWGYNVYVDGKVIKTLEN
ncbi:MAG TPA: hypothetical protein C5S37_08670 [Methanophagales archaeon]|nr:hypothetical protein [Methanophagales archaeon]